MPVPVNAVTIQLTPSLEIGKAPSMHVAIDPTIQNPMAAILMLQQAQTAIMQKMEAEMEQARVMAMHQVLANGNLQGGRA